MFPIEEISLQPELSRPSRFRIQGGWSERDEQSPDGHAEILLSIIGYPYYSNPEEGGLSVTYKRKNIIG